MRRRLKYHLQKQQSDITLTCASCGQEVASPSLPGGDAEAGQAESLQSAPQPGITYLHDEHTKVTLPKWDWDPTKVVLRDMSDYPAKLEAIVEASRPKRRGRPPKVASA